MRKIIESIRKEALVVLRDRAGLAIIFLMPMALIIIMTLLQDSSFKKFGDSKTPILFIDNDKDTLGISIRNGLMKSGNFILIEKIEDKLLDENLINELVSDGIYQLGIIIPENSSDVIRTTVKKYVNASMITSVNVEKIYNQKINIKIFTDPMVVQTFKNSIIASLENFTTKIELKIISEAFSSEINKRIPGSFNSTFKGDDILIIDEKIASKEKDYILPNSVQHNVPAWTIFAIFFIVIPLASHIIKERNDGSYYRIQTLPVSYLTVLTGKIVVYVIISLILVLLLFSLGYFIMPVMNLPALNIGKSIFSIMFVSVSTALAATGYGVLVGTVATTHYQASSFAAISILILAAIGGIWVPIYVMPEVMKNFSIVSPLNWGLNGFYNIFLRGYGINAVFTDCIKLLLFFISTMTLAFLYKKYIRNK